MNTNHKKYFDAASSETLMNKGTQQIEQIIFWNENESEDKKLWSTFWRRSGNI